MAIVPFPIDRKFLQEVRDAVFRFARKNYASWASEEDCEDLTQEAMLELFDKVHKGELKELTCNLKTFVIGIMRKNASKKIRKMPPLVNALPTGQDEDDVLDPVDLAIAREVVGRWHDADSDEEQDQLQHDVLELVEKMPDPCKRILRSYYWEGKDMKEIADEMDYASADVAKTKKSRCMTKVKAEMERIIKRM